MKAKNQLTAEDSSIKAASRRITLQENFLQKRMETLKKKHGSSLIINKEDSSNLQQENLLIKNFLQQNQKKIRKDFESRVIGLPQIKDQSTFSTVSTAMLSKSSKQMTFDKLQNSLPSNSLPSRKRELTDSEFQGLAVLENDARREIFKTSKGALKKPINYCNFSCQEFDVLTGDKLGKKPSEGIGTDLEYVYDDYRKTKQAHQPGKRYFRDVASQQHLKTTPKVNKVIAKQMQYLTDDPVAGTSVADRIQQIYDERKITNNNLNSFINRNKKQVLLNSLRHGGPSPLRPMLKTREKPQSALDFYPKQERAYLGVSQKRKDSVKRDQQQSVFQTQPDIGQNGALTIDDLYKTLNSKHKVVEGSVASVKKSQRSEVWRLGEKLRKQTRKSSVNSPESRVSRRSVDDEFDSITIRGASQAKKSVRDDSVEPVSAYKDYPMTQKQSVSCLNSTRLEESALQRLNESAKKSLKMSSSKRSASKADSVVSRENSEQVQRRLQNLENFIKQKKSKKDQNDAYSSASEFFKKQGSVCSVGSDIKVIDSIDGHSVEEEGSDLDSQSNQSQEEDCYKIEDFGNLTPDEQQRKIEKSVQKMQKLNEKIEKEKLRKEKLEEIVKQLRKNQSGDKVISNTVDLE